MALTLIHKATVTDAIQLKKERKLHSPKESKDYKKSEEPQT